MNKQRAKKDSVDEYIKLLGVTLKVKTYLVIQISIITTSIFLGVMFCFLMEGQYMGFEALHIGLLSFLLAAMEAVETLYAMKKKRFTK